MDTEKKLTTGKAARVLRVCPRTVARLCDDGVLKHYRIPGSTHRQLILGDVLDFARENGIPPLTDFLEGE